MPGQGRDADVRISPAPKFSFLISPCDATSGCRRHEGDPSDRLGVDRCPGKAATLTSASAQPRSSHFSFLPVMRRVAVADTKETRPIDWVWIAARARPRR